MAEVVQVVTPPRWSVTVTTPSGPEMVVAVVEETSEPRTAFSVGALIESAPAVSVKDIGVMADAGVTFNDIASRTHAAPSAGNSFDLISQPRLRQGLGRSDARIRRSN